MPTNISGLDATALAIFCFESGHLAVGVVAGAIITNVTDPRDPIYSKAWFLHCGIACLTTVLFVEGRYWKQWADSGDEQPLPAAIDQAKQAAKATEDAIAKVENIAPKGQQ